MGYYTNYSLQIKDTKTKELIGVDHPKFNDIVMSYSAITGYSFDSSKEDIVLLLDETDDWKWYENEKDMLFISGCFPDYIFYLEGKGEEREDWWVKIFHNETVILKEAKLVSPWEDINMNDMGYNSF